MNKIPTIFVRGQDGLLTEEREPRAAWFWSDLLWCLNGGIDYVVDVTEKLDGTNVRLTVRCGQVVRVERRKNPSKVQKRQGMLDPWYTEVDVAAVSAGLAPADKWIAAAVEGTDTSGWPDGEHCCEALGPKIQGNPLGLQSHRCVPFNMRGDLGVPRYTDVTARTFEGFRAWLRDLESLYSPGHLAEGVVFHGPHGARAKLKRKDFWRE